MLPNGNSPVILGLIFIREVYSRYGDFAARVFSDRAFSARPGAAPIPGVYAHIYENSK